MPNIKSAIKRVKTTATKHEANILKKGSMKTAVKKVEKEAFALDRIKRIHFVSSVCGDFCSYAEQERK